MGYKIPGEKIEGRFIKRLNRFEAIVEIEEKEILCHVPNTGRLRELLLPNAKVFLVRSNNKKRKTEWTLMFVEKNKGLVCINSAMANRVLESAIKENVVKSEKGVLKREVSFYNSKFDFFIDGDEKTFIEVKCATFEENGIAKFPDAPTDRGRRHIEELIKAVELGYKAKIIFVAFMDFVNLFTPYKEMDEKFALTLKKAKEKGVEVIAYRCSIELDEINVIDKITVEL